MMGEYRVAVSSSGEVRRIYPNQGSALWRKIPEDCAVFYDENGQLREEWWALPRVERKLRA